MGAPSQGDRLRQVTDVATAAWVEDAVQDLSPAIPALLPAGFEAYARVFHPAEGPGPGGVSTSWSELAARAGRGLGPLTRFEEIRGTAAAEPGAGSFPEELLPLLCDLLAAHTATPQYCCMGLWDGWGWIGRADEAARLDLGSRRYLLYEGPVDAAVEMGDRGEGYSFPQSPNLWWPRDRAWCVATDVDLDSTYLGGSARLVGVLTGEPRLEALPVEPPAARRA